MSRETERVFREMHKYLEQFEDLTEEEAEKKISEFMDEYNAKLLAGEPVEKDQWYYLDLAMDAEDEKMARKHAQRALSIDPYCTDAELILINLMDATMEEIKKRYEKLVEKTEAHLREEGYFEDDNIGDFYGILETRPYMRALGEYLDLLIRLGKYRMAEATAQKMIHLNENDNMGARYRLIALYAVLEDTEAAESLYEQYPEENTFMLLPLVMLYYKKDDYTKARRYLKIAARKNPDLKKMMKEQLTEEYVEEQFSQGGYRPNTIGEILQFFEEAEFLLESSKGGILWLKNEVKKLK